MAKKVNNEKVLSLMKARRLLIEGATVEEVSEGVKLDINSINALRNSMIQNLFSTKEYMDEIREDVFDALHEDNMLWLEQIA